MKRNYLTLWNRLALKPNINFSTKYQISKKCPPTSGQPHHSQRFLSVNFFLSNFQESSAVTVFFLVFERNIFLCTISFNFWFSRITLFWSRKNEKLFSFLFFPQNQRKWKLVEVYFVYWWIYETLMERCDGGGSLNWSLDNAHFHPAIVECSCEQESRD